MLVLSREITEFSLWEERIEKQIQNDLCLTFIQERQRRKCTYICKLVKDKRNTVNTQRTWNQNKKEE